MVGKYGEVYVMDWGLARALGQEDRHDLRLRASAPETISLRTDRKQSREGGLDSPLETMDGRVLGTPCYMPPEQALGRIEAMGLSSDVYSMGAVLYQLMSGRIPYVPEQGEVTARTVLAMVIQGPPERLAKLAPNAPAELVAICEKAMAREMDARYPHMEALAADLRAFLEGRVVAAYERGAWAELRKWVGRNRGWAATGASALVLLIAALGWAVVERDRADGEATRATVEATRANGLAEKERLAKEEANEARAAAVAEKERVLRLSDIKLLADFSAEAKALWPEEPRLIPALVAWLEKARRLHTNLPIHEAHLAEVRERALIRAPEQIEAERAAHPKQPDLLRERGRLAWLRSLAPVVAGDSPLTLPSLDGEALPTDASALNALAWPLIDPDRNAYGEESRGGALAERLAALDPPEAGLWDTVARARFATGRFPEARRAMATVVERASSAEKAQYSVGMARLDEAIAFFSGEGAAARYAAMCAEVEGGIVSLEAEVAERQRWDFTEEEADLAWQHQVLTELVAGLGVFGGQGGAIADVAARLERASKVEALTMSGPEAAGAWQTAIASIRDRAECPLYDGLVLRPQLGLVPLDRNPETGLWEFWHPRTGTRPERNPEYDPELPAKPPAPGEPAAPGKCNRWVITEETGLVFVLIPGGTFRMGAERPTIGAATEETPEGLRVARVVEGSLATLAGVAVGDILRSVNGVATPTQIELTASLATVRSGEVTRFAVLRGEEEQLLSALVERGVGSPNVDPWAQPLESPVHEVTLGPYFLSKYEMTQGQWSRSPAEERQPSTYEAGQSYAGQPVTCQHPVESVSWAMCRDTLGNLGLTLPTEAQWERGCRGGTGSVFWSGDANTDLAGVGNIGDRFAKRVVPAWNCTMELDDGFVLHSPVGSLRSNANGLHDVHGGVWEWCLDSYVGYENPIGGPDGLRRDDSANPDRVSRGGAFISPATIARSASRLWYDTAFRGINLGARPSRVVSE